MSEPSVATTGTTDPSARIKRIPAPIASPGSCVICGKNEHPDGFAQTDNLDFEFYGTVYFCADCVGDYARAFGYLSSDDLVGLREHIDAQNTELNTLRQAVLGLESTVDGLVADAHRRSTKRADDITRGRPPAGNSGVLINSVDEPNAGLPDASVGGTDPVPPRTQPDVTEPTPEQRPNDLSGSASADELLGL